MDWRKKALLSLVRIGVENPTLERMHGIIERELRTGSKYIDDVSKDADDEYREAVVDAECERAEDLLGMAFMVAQSYITGVRTRLAKTSQACESRFGRARTRDLSPAASY